MLFLLSGGVFAFSQCTKQNVTDGVQNMDDTKSLNQGSDSQISNGGNSGSAYLFNCISSLPVEALSISEISALSTMREEELLAEDVYVLFYSIYNIPVFNNISRPKSVIRKQ